MHLTQEACEKVWLQDVLVLSRNVLFCDCCEQKDKAPQPLLSCCRLVPSQVLSGSHCTLHRWPRTAVRSGVEDVGIPGHWGFKGAFDPLLCLLLASVWERCPCMHIYHMQMDFELCVLSEFRKGVIWRKNPPGNAAFASTGLLTVICGGGRSGNEGEVHWGFLLFLLRFGKTPAKAHIQSDESASLLP